jgi:zinc transporter 1
LADAFHMFSDIIATGIAIYAIRMAKKHPSETKSINTYGWQRAEILGAFANAVFLLALCLAILIEAVERFISPSEIYDPVMVLAVGSGGLAINLIGIWLFHGYQKDGHHTHHKSSVVGSGSGEEEQMNNGDNEIRPPLTSLVITGLALEKDTLTYQQKLNRRCQPSCLNHNCTLPEHHTVNPVIVEEEERNIIELKEKHYNMRGVFVHVLGDALGSIGVIISALIIWLTKFDARFYFDPIMSVVIVAIIVTTTFPLMRNTGFILLQGVPEAVDLDKIYKDLMKLPGVLNLHELHVWQLSDTKLIASAHVVCDEIQSYMEIASQIKETFHRYGIHSSTIQPEFVYSDQSEDSVCLLQCLKDSCQEKLCCVRLRTSLPEAGLKPI